MLLSLDHITFGYTDTPVVTDVSLTVNEGEKIGFVGSNGEGKTTLIKLMLGVLTPDSGSVTHKKGLRLGYLEQSGGLESALTVYEAMEEVFEEDRRLTESLRQTERAMAALTAADGAQFQILSAKCESLNQKIAARDSYHYDVRIKTVLNGMGFIKSYGQTVNTLSGGEKTRLKLCKLLLEEPELLVLDEPTNHLDTKTLFWLEDYLTTYRGSLFVVSHDRFFLDRLTARTLELERGRLSSYKGNYSKYKQLKAEEIKRRQREYEQQVEEIQKLREYVQKNIVRATTAKSAQSRVKQLDRMELVEKVAPPPAPPRFGFLYDQPPYERVLEARDFTVSVADKTLLTRANFTLTRGDKCALLGDNGSGKSTLLKYFLSRHPEVNIGKYVKIAYYDQENADLDPEERVLEAFWGQNVGMSQTEARKLLAQSGLSAEDVLKKVKELSGGLRAKLELARVQAKRGNVLFLDEPTNHLDLPAREALEEALRVFDGTILFVSHDRRFIQSVANKIVYIENQSLEIFSGTYTEYLERQKSQPSETPQKREPKTESTDGYRSKEDRAREAKKKERIKQIETRLEEAEAEERALNESLAENASDFRKLQEITRRLEELHALSDELYAEYETLIS